MSREIQKGKYLYHLTCLSNLGSILQNGLLPRAELQPSFQDVADKGILQKRQHLELDKKVPFHFFTKNPFDYRVQCERPEEMFVIIGVLRIIAEEQNWYVIPQHPLASDGDIQLFDYQEGLSRIDWQTMEKCDYSDKASKSICMAECLAPGVVAPELFQSIWVKDNTAKLAVDKLLKTTSYAPYLNVNDRMFIKL